MPEINNLDHFVKWFRYSSPYINAHQGKTFVILFDGEAVADDGFAHLIHDFALLNSLGIKLVLIHGARPQIEAQLALSGQKSHISNNIRITDEASMKCVKQAVGSVKIEIESMLSMGVINSPMAGAKLKVVSGNFITAKPQGVVNGTDYCFTGEVRKIDTSTIQKQLADGSIVLLSPIGYSPTGEAFNLTAEDVAVQTAISINADKFIFLTDNAEFSDTSGKKLRQITLAEGKTYLNEHSQLPEEERHNLACSLEMMSKGIQRVHLLDRKIEGALLLELFSRDGIGTLITTNNYDTIREASIDDIGGILELIVPLENKGILVRRSREQLEINISQFTVMERDGMIIGCAALHYYKEDHVAEVSCLAVHPDYRNEKRGETLLNIIEKQATKSNCTKLFALTVKTAHWFIENGFIETEINQLPMTKQSLYNFQRNSKVFAKNIVTSQ